MSVNQFMSANLPTIQRIINEMPRPFDTHAFIRVFSRQFQVDYVRLLSKYPTDPFEAVHKQIGRFLLDNKVALGITEQGKVDSANIFGLISDNEQWN